jgi:ATP-dependent DNA helicase RecG
MERPTIWDEVSDWIDRNGALANADLCRIAGVDTLKASKMLKAWVEQGVLIQQSVTAKRYTSYVKPAQPPAQRELLSDEQDN